MVSSVLAQNSYAFVCLLDLLLQKMNFIGKPALQRQKEQGLMKQLVFFQLNDIDPDVDIWPWGGEPLYRNNEYVGTVTSAG